MGGDGGGGKREEGHSCTRETPNNLQQVTEGGGIHRQETGRGRRQCGEEHASNENERDHLTGPQDGVLVGDTNFIFFNFCEWSGSRWELTKTNFTRLSLWRQTAVVSSSPLPLSQVTSSMEQRGRPGRVGGGLWHHRAHLHPPAHTRSPPRTACPSVQSGNILVRPPALPHSLSHNFFFLSSLPVPPSHSFPLPSLPPFFSPCVLPSLLHSVCPPISSILLSFPLLPLPPSLPLYLRLLFFYSKLNLSL